YSIVAQAPEYDLDTMRKLQSLPVTSSASGVTPQSLGALGSFSRTRTNAVVTHYNVLPTADIFAATQDRDLGAVADDIQKIVNANKKTLPRGSAVVLRGQIVTMNTAFS